MKFTIATKTIQRAALPVVEGGLITLKLVKDLGVSANNADSLLKSGREIKVQVNVVRLGPFSSGPSITIAKAVTLNIP